MDDNAQLDMIVNKLKRGSMCPRDVPDELKQNRRIIDAERSAGYRTIGNRGFDIIRNEFFVEEDVTDIAYLFKGRYNDISWFPDFDSYSDYVDGNIYDDSCYYQWDCSGIPKDVDIAKIKSRTSLIDYNIDSFNSTQDELKLQDYLTQKRNKKAISKWVDKFLSCDSYESFVKIAKAYEKSVQRVDITFFIWQFISFDSDENRLQIVLKYLANNTFRYPNSILEPLCTLYSVDDVLKYFEYPNSHTKAALGKYRRFLKEYINYISSDNYKKGYYAGFDDVTHYYYVCFTDKKSAEFSYSAFSKRDFRRYEYGAYIFFETIDGLVEYLDYDLTATDLSSDYELDYDFSKCIISENTLFPLTILESYKHKITKTYKNGQFHVKQEWIDQSGRCVRSSENHFRYFFDFVAFLKGDLSGADLIDCDGLANLKDTSGLNLNDAMIRSFTGLKFKLPQTKYDFLPTLCDTFEPTVANERESSMILSEQRPKDELDNYYSKVFYVSDIHLLHRLDKNNAVTEADVIYSIRRVVESLLKDDICHLLLIDGDTSSDVRLFASFVKQLRESLDEHYLSSRTRVVFTLGNHELWGFAGQDLVDVYEFYRDLLSQYGMYLLQNCILYEDFSEERLGEIKYITAEEILSLGEKDIRALVRESKTILFGGLAFSGYNPDFNADKAVYRSTVNREREIQETELFEALYNRILSVIPDKQVIVVTHTPLKDWHNKEEYHSNYIYVSGHNHRNYYYDDGEIRIYSDNQIGYYADSVHAKWFETDGQYDYFDDYSDGVYKISKKEYISFYRGKNNQLSFNRDYKTIIMLKKNGYYCFIVESKPGKLCILNGGSMKSLSSNDVNYYYENMDSVIAAIRGPFDKYTDIQKQVSEEVRKIGGSGRIHGCIIDIDFNNHIYVNPLDLKLTAYWASDIVRKKVYPNVPELLKQECPLLYQNYNKMIEGNNENLPAIYHSQSLSNKRVRFEYSTEIYKASREIRKMQRLNSQILTVWDDDCLERDGKHLDAN